MRWWLVCVVLVLVGFGRVDGFDEEGLVWKKSKKLLASMVVMRHGDRAVQRTAPAYAAGGRQTFNAKFPIDNYTWPVDYGQLTGKGAMQAKNLGAYLRDRYVGHKKMLEKDYNHYETHVRSTDVDRTLVSCMAAMSGLYPGESQMPGFEGTVLVPVHTVPYATDALMDGSSAANCPKFNQEAIRLLSSERVRKAILSHEGLMKAMPMLANVSESQLSAMSGPRLVRLVTSLRDLRLCQRAHDMYQPESVTKFDSDLEELTEMITNVKWRDTNMGNLVGGRLLRAIANRFRAVIAVRNNEQWAVDKMHEECNAKGSDSDEDGGCPRKLALYTGHDTTIFDIRAALGCDITVPGVVPYVSHVIVELEQSDEEYIVSVLAGSYLEKAKPLKGKFCGGESYCSLKQFLRYVDSTVPADIEAACALDNVMKPSRYDAGDSYLLAQRRMRKVRRSSTLGENPASGKVGISSSASLFRMYDVLICITAAIVGSIGALVVSARARRVMYAPIF